jgi:hypothetical protein
MSPPFQCCDAAAHYLFRAWPCVKQMKFYYHDSESLEYGYATEVGLSKKCPYVSLSLTHTHSLSHTHTSGVEISGLFYSFIPGMEHRL